MTPVAIGMMIFSLALVGGGFIASIIRLQKGYLQVFSADWLQRKQHCLPL